jgi:hypothetical protein
MYHHHVRRADDAGDGRDVAQEIEIEFFVERGVNGIRRTGQEKRIAVGLRADDRLGAQIAASARPVFNNERLA